MIWNLILLATMYVAVSMGALWMTLCTIDSKEEGPVSIKQSLFLSIMWLPLLIKMVIKEIMSSFKKGS